LNQLRGGIVMAPGAAALAGERTDVGADPERDTSETVTAGYHLSYVEGRAIAVLLATVSAICG
jgi:hypothetical protein